MLQVVTGDDTQFGQSVELLLSVGRSYMHDFNADVVVVIMIPILSANLFRAMFSILLEITVPVLFVELAIVIVPGHSVVCIPIGINS